MVSYERGTSVVTEKPGISHVSKSGQIGHREAWNWSQPCGGAGETHELCTLHPTPYALRLTQFTLHHTFCTLHPALVKLMSTGPYTLHPTPCTLHLAPITLHSAPYTRHPALYT